MIDFNNNIYLGVASPDMERDLSNYYTKAQTRALVDTKQDIITGAATTITEDNLTANRAVISNASGKVAVSNVTSTELGYLSGVTSEVQTQLNNKASTSLDNLSADGQMIIDSQNGTISNCILEIPQNIKLTLENNVLTLKAGSILTLSGSTYATITTTEDKIKDYSSQGNGKFYVFIDNSGLYFNTNPINSVVSGATDDLAGQTYHTWFDTTNKVINRYSSDASTSTSTFAYPLCIIIKDSNGVRFAKDSNGNDMIFNGAGFIGHHAFIYPDVKFLRPNGFNTQGKLKSIEVTSNSLLIYEMKSNVNSITLNGASSGSTRQYYEVDNLDTSLQGFQYVKSENVDYFWNGAEYVERYETKVINFSVTGTTVTDFAIRQPYQGARNLLTDDLYKQIGDVETLLAAI